MIKNISFSANAEFLSDAMSFVDFCIDEVMSERAGGLSVVRGLAVTADRAQEALHADMPAPRPSLAAQFDRIQEMAAQSEAYIPLYQIWVFMQATPFERFCSLVALSAAYDRKYALLYGYLNDDIRLNVPNLGCALAMFSMIGRVDDGETAGFFADADGFAAYVFAKPEREGLEAELLLNDKARLATLGSEAVSASVSEFSRILPQVEEELQYGLENNRLPDLIALVLDGNRNACIQLIGQTGSGRKRLMQTFCAKTGLKLLCVDAAGLPKESGALQTAAKNLCIEALLSSALMLIDGADSMEAAALETVLRILTRRMKLTLLSVQSARVMNLPAGVMSLQVEFPLPTVEASKQLWLRELGDENTATYMADKVRMTPGRILDTVMRARHDAALMGVQEPDSRQLMHAVREAATHKMEGRARRINAFYTWDDLVVSEETERELRLFCDRVRYRYQVMENWNFKSRLAYGRAVSALFYGVPGTGKTMAAQVLANDLDMDLYRVDLSQIMNKYVGETEKNLARIFEEAELSGGILFFDEADALFAKRTEVDSSNDKYANAETAFLLQKIEEFDGQIILATNLAYNFDDAFKRRINYMINFTLPDEKQRRALWQKVFPAEMHAEEYLDIDFLAESFQLSGSTIKSIAVSAAYRAAAAGEEINMTHVIRALKHEYVKTGEILTRSRLREYDVD